MLTTFAAQSFNPLGYQSLSHPAEARRRSPPPMRTLSKTLQDKHRLYLNRYNLLLQRLRRNRRFQPPNLLQAAAGAAPQAQLTELMGLKGTTGETCIVMGIIGSQVSARMTPLRCSPASVQLVSCVPRCTQIYAHCSCVARVVCLHTVRPRCRQTVAVTLWATWLLVCSYNRLRKGTHSCCATHTLVCRRMATLQ